MKLKLCEIMQQLDHINIQNVVDVLNNNPAIKDYAMIVHDKDVDVAPHVHVAIRLKDSYDTKYVAQWFGIAEQYVGKVKGRWADMLKYLIHENAPDKHQYSPSEVFSNFDWVKVKDTLSEDERKKEIINGIVDGKIREYNYYEYISAEEYVKYKRVITDAYSYRADKLKGVDRQMECLYITGASGTGKTTYAKDIATQKGYSIFVSSGSNDVLDNYKGEDCIILDDLRPSCMGLSDLLKMLDNNTSSTVKSRYRNKVLECKLIIITSVLPLETFYKGVFDSENEPIVQFKRRCRTHIRLTEDYAYMRIFNPTTNEYGREIKTINACSKIFEKKEMSEEEQLQFLEDLLGGPLEVVKEVRAVNMSINEFVTE